jgi:hypothetical protein
MHLFECEATFEAEPAEVWKVWTDVERWPEWDVSKEIARLDGPFQPGVCGWAKQRGNLGGPFTITAVDDGRRWVTECQIPLGKVVFDHLLEPAAEGHVRVVKRVEVYGGFGSLLRLIAPKMRRDITRSLAALERQLSALGTRRHGHQAHGFGPSQSTKRHVLRASVDVRQESFSRPYRRLLARGARRLRLPSVTGFPSGSVLGGQSSRLQGLRSMAKVPRRTVALDPVRGMSGHCRCWTAMYKYSDRAVSC